jgi:glutathione S-transferase
MFSQKRVERSPEQQKKVDEQTASLVLYHFPACPYCHLVRREIHRLSLDIQQRNINQSKVWHKELLRGGGKGQVPCLLIREGKGERWMYESDAIMRYLKNRFGGV